METLKSQYERMTSKRSTVLEKAKRASMYTIPSLYEDNENESYPNPNQSTGSMGVNNLASKIAMTLLPPNSPFFRWIGDTIKLKQQAQEAGEDPELYEQEFNKNLSSLTEYVKDSIEEAGDRVAVGEGVKHLIIGGNVFFLDKPDDNLVYYSLNRYVVKRDYKGNVLKAITKESVGFEALPHDVREKVKSKYSENEDLETKEFDIFTGFIRSKKGKIPKWLVYQEVEEIPIKETRGEYPIDKPPFIACRWTAIAGKDYGRGLIEDVIGDIRSLDDVSKAVTEGAKASARVITMVNPSGLTRMKQLANARNGAIISGRKEDVTFCQTEKYHDLATAQRREETLEKKLGRVFLMAESVTRDAERVTAYEIQYMVAKLEEALGNTYSLLLMEFQKAYLTIKYHHLRMKNKDLPNINKYRGAGVKLVITTGIDALVRNNEALKKDLFFEKLKQIAEVAQMLGLKLRENRLLTQEELAELVGVQPGTITSIETGLRFVSERTLKALVKALKTDYIELFNFGEKIDCSYSKALVCEISSLSENECEYFLKTIRLYKDLQK